MARTASDRLSATARELLPGLIQSLRHSLGDRIYEPISKTFIASLLNFDTGQVDQLVNELVHMNLAEWQNGKKNVQLLSQVYRYEASVKAPLPIQKPDEKKQFKRQMWDLATVLAALDKVELCLDDPDLERVITECSGQLQVIRDVFALLEFCASLKERGLTESSGDCAYTVKPDQDLGAKIAARRPESQSLAPAPALVETDGVVVVVQPPEPVVGHHLKQIDPPLVTLPGKFDLLEFVDDGYTPPEKEGWYKFLRKQFYNSKNYWWARWLHRRTDSSPFILESSLTGSRSPISERKLRTLLNTLEKIGMVIHDEETDWWRWRHAQLPIEFLTDVGDILNEDGTVFHAWRSFR